MNINNMSSYNSKINLWDFIYSDHSLSDENKNSFYQFKKKREKVYLSVKL